MIYAGVILLSLLFFVPESQNEQKKWKMSVLIHTLAKHTGMKTF